MRSADAVSRRRRTGAGEHEARSQGSPWRAARVRAVGRPFQGRPTISQRARSVPLWQEPSAESADLLRRQAHEPRVPDRRNPANCRDGLVERTWPARFLVDVDDADGAGFAAPEREVGDIHAEASQNRADLADYARLVVVRDEQHRAGQRRLDLHTADRDEARAVRLEHRSLRPAFSVARVQLERDEAREVPRPRTARFDDLDAALAGGRPGVDD